MTASQVLEASVQDPSSKHDETGGRAATYFTVKDTFVEWLRFPEVPVRVSV